MSADAVLLPKVFPEGLLELGYLTTNPVYPNLQPFKPPPSVLDSLKELETKREPTKNVTSYWAIAKRGWFSLQLVRLLGIHTHVSARTLLVVEGGETVYQTFNNINDAYVSVFAAKETQTWINKVSKTSGKVYFVGGIEHISGASVTRVGTNVSGVERRIFLDDFGLHNTNDVTGIFAVEYYEVKIRSEKSDTSPSHELRPKVTWVRPATIVMGEGGEDTPMEVSLEGRLVLDTLREMAEVAIKEEDEDEDE